MEDEDTGWIKETIDGNKFAFEKLVEKYKHLLFNVIFRLCQNKVETEDIVQETFIKVYSKLQKYNSEFRFKDWLYKIAINLTKDKLRRRKFSFLSFDKLIQTEEDELTLQFEDKTQNLEIKLIAEEEKLKLNQALSSLPVKYKTVVALRYFDDLPYEEISEITGLPLGTVKIRLLRAKKILLKKIL